MVLAKVHDCADMPSEHQVSRCSAACWMMWRPEGSPGSTRLHPNMGPAKGMPQALAWNCSNSVTSSMLCSIRQRPIWSAACAAECMHACMNPATGRPPHLQQMCRGSRRLTSTTQCTQAAAGQHTECWRLPAQQRCKRMWSWQGAPWAQSSAGMWCWPGPPHQGARSSGPAGSCSCTAARTRSA